MIDTTELYILIVVEVALTWIKSHRDVWKENFCANYLTKFIMILNRIPYAIDTCWSDELHTHFISPNQYSRERTQLRWIHQENFNIGLHSDIFRLISFILGVIIETTKLIVLFENSLNNFDLHSRLQLCEKAESSALIFLQISVWMKYGM